MDRRWPAEPDGPPPGSFSPDVSLLNRWEVDGLGAPRDLGRAPSDQSADIAGPAVADTARDGGRMVAPTGVNEELPQEPAKAGQPGTELAEPQAAGAEAAPTQAAEEADEKAAPAAVVPAELVPPQAEPAEEERVAAAPVEAKPADADATETEPAETALAEAAPAGADAGGAADPGLRAEPVQAAASPGGASRGDWDGPRKAAVMSGRSRWPASSSGSLPWSQWQ